MFSKSTFWKSKIESRAKAEGKQKHQQWVQLAKKYLQNRNGNASSLDCGAFALSPVKPHQTKALSSSPSDANSAQNHHRRKKRQVAAAAASSSSASFSLSVSPQKSDGSSSTELAKAAFAAADDTQQFRRRGEWGWLLCFVKERS